MPKITISTTIASSVDTVWEMYTKPEHIVNWNNASDDWHTTKAENDLKIGGRFLSRMEAKDGSQGFDFTGIYNEVEVNKFIKYILDDGRTAEISFTDDGEKTSIVITFDADEEYPLDMQEDGWQAILDNFKSYVEKRNNSS